MPLLWALILALFTAQSASAETFGDANSVGWDADTVTFKLLRINSERATEYARLNGDHDIAKFEFRHGGQVHIVKALGIDGYAKIFRETGGPTIRKLTGLDLRFMMNFGSFFFAVYTAILCLMVGLYWFKMLGEVSKGKGNVEITPLIVKLAVGLVFAYNLPFVYGFASVLKDTGQIVILAAMGDTGLAASGGNAPAPNPLLENLRSASIANIQKASTRADAVAIAARTRLTEELSSLSNASTPEASGRKLLAAYIARTNTLIKELNAPSTKELVKDSSGAWNLEQSIGDNSDLLPMAGFREGESEYTNPATQSSSRQSTLSKEQATNVDAILRVMIPDSASVPAAIDMLSGALSSYVRLQSICYSSKAEALKARSLQVPPRYYIVNRPSEGMHLGDALNVVWGRQGTSDAEGPALVQAMQRTVHPWFNINFARDPEIVEAKKDLEVSTSGNSSGGFWSTVIDLIKEIPKNIANMFLWVTKMFWIPMVAHLADFLFNFTIEAYVYIAMLAYPFWFYDKTAKAFPGAVNTLIAQSMTTAVFCLLIMMFEGFAGHLLNSVLGLGGATAAAGTAAAGTAIAAGGLAAVSLVPLAVGTFIGIGIGYSVFYIVGTGICLRIAPQIYKAFLEGSSVVTPMVMGAMTAVVAGGAGAIMGGMAAAGAAAKLGGAVSKSATMQGVKNRLANTSFGRAASSISKSVSARASQASGAVKKGLSKLQEGNSDFAKGMRAIGKDAKSIQHAAGEKFREIKANPRQALYSLANSNAANIALTAGVGLTGDPSKVLSTLGTKMFAQELIASRAGATEGKKSPGSGGHEADKANAQGTASANRPAPDINTEFDEKATNLQRDASGFATRDQIITRRINLLTEIQEQIKRTPPTNPLRAQLQTQREVISKIKHPDEDTKTS
jgi:hypothetical protein